MVRWFFSKAREHHLQFKTSKCKIAFTETKFLGFIINQQGRSPDPAKIAVLKQYPFPSTVQDVRRFLGFINYLREYVPSITTLTVPFRRYLIKAADINGLKTDEHARECFDKLISSIVDDAVLTWPDWEAAKEFTTSGRPFEIFVDASQYAIGCVLTQRASRDGPPRPIAVFSTALSPVQMRWDVFDQELYAMVNANEKCRPYIKGFFSIMWFDNKTNLKMSEILALWH